VNQNFTQKTVHASFTYLSNPRSITESQFVHKGDAARYGVFNGVKGG
jgi:hypothetical protein